MRQRLETEVATRLRRPPFTGGAVRQRVHLSRQLLAGDAVLARAFQPEWSHLRVRIVAQFVRLVDLNTSPPGTLCKPRSSIDNGDGRWVYNSV